MNDSFEKVDKETIGMLRSAHMKQTQLTMLADQKAHMLTGIILMVKVTKPSSVVAVQNLAKLEITLNLTHYCRFRPIVQCSTALCFLPKLDRPLRRSFFNLVSCAQNEYKVHF